VPDASVRFSRDWLGSLRTSTVARWIPCGALLLALFAPVPFRAAIWTIALIWMGIACMLDARRCNRTCCRFTGPYYLALTAPVLALGFGIVSAGIYGWIVLGVLIVAGSTLIWWVTERAWGKFS
jgi:hypothetical protein